MVGQHETHFVPAKSLEACMEMGVGFSQPNAAIAADPPIDDSVHGLAQGVAPAGGERQARAAAVLANSNGIHGEKQGQDHTPQGSKHDNIPSQEERLLHGSGCGGKGEASAVAVFAMPSAGFALVTGLAAAPLFYGQAVRPVGVAGKESPRCRGASRRDHAGIGR